MKRSPFAVVSLIAGILLIIPAILIAIIDGLGLPESNPLVVIAFPIVLLFSLPEAPVQMFANNPGLPIILPLLSIICGAVSIKKQEPGKSMALKGILLTVVSVAIHLVIRFMYA